MKQEIQNWIKLSVILSVVLIAAVQAAAFTSEISTEFYNGAQSTIVMAVK